MMTTNAITVEHLDFEYPGVRALDKVGFCIERGSITALVGPNGAGKTTLLRCIAALELPLVGQIRVDGIDVLDQPRACHRRVGYLSDSFGLYDALTIRQCLRYSAEANGIDPLLAAGAVLDTAEKLGLTSRLSQRAGELSRGLRQRVAIGQAIIHRPSVILLDEPAAGLDPEARHDLSALFRLLQADGMTLLVSSHILAELAEYSTDMLVLKAGKVIDHRPIKPTSGDFLAFELSLASPVDDIVEVLSAQAGVRNVTGTGLIIRFEFSGNAAARSMLLRSLLDSDIPVCGLSEVRHDMQASYLASIGAKHKEISP